MVHPVNSGSTEGSQALKMVAASVAYFVRPRAMELGRLEKRPQESLEVVHAILHASIKETLMKLKHVERQFYGSGKHAVDELRRWVGHFKHTRPPGQIIFDSKQKVDDLIKLSMEPDYNFRYDQFELNKLKECARKVLYAVPDAFHEVVRDVKLVLMYMEKYCLSFYDLDDEQRVEYDTAIDYEKQRRHVSEVVREQVQAISSMGEKFRNGAFSMADLTDFGVELSRKVDVSCAPFLLMFPECCESVRVACQKLQSWIEADSMYDLFVRNDIRDFEARHAESTHLLRDLQQRYYQLTFRHKQLVSDSIRLEADLNRLLAKDDELTIEEEMLTNDCNELQNSIEAKEFARDVLMKNADVMHPQVLYEKYTTMSDELRELRHMLPVKIRHLSNCRAKLNYITEKKSELAHCKKNVADVQREVEEIDERKQEEDIQHQANLKLLTKAKQIHLFKSTPDAVNKIYHELPVETNKARLPGNKGDKDPFEKTCQMVCKLIDSDWHKLYRNLPFFPKRGASTIDLDVSEITANSARAPNEQLALKALYRWRRFHTRAKLEDVLRTLQRIRRHDIYHKIMNMLHPKQEAVVVKDDKDYSYVERELIPYVKEVEKFDRLLLAGRFGKQQPRISYFNNKDK